MWNNGKTFNGTAGNDTIDLGWQNPVDVRDNANGFGGDDTIYGNIADNNLNGNEGNDIIFGGWGDDTIHGNEDDDYLSGDDGNDKLFGDEGSDALFGGNGDDEMHGGSQNDLLMGDDGNDILFGDSGDDTMYGDEADANVGNGKDILYGGAGSDSLHGGGGNDTLVGDDDAGPGWHDVLDGGSGNDTLIDSFSTSATNGNDVMMGGDGNDSIESSFGADKLYGDAGNDVFNIVNFNHNHLNDAGLEIHGDSGIDTLSITATPGMVFHGLGAHTDGIEHVALDPNDTMTLNLSFRDVINDSDSHLLTFSGNGNDTLNLDTFVAFDPLSGGHWVQGSTQLTNDPAHPDITYNYDIGTSVMASVVVNSAIHVEIYNPIPINPDIHPDIHVNYDLHL